MDAINWVVDVVVAFTKHGFQPTAIVIAVVALLKVKAVQKRILRRLPRRYWQEDRMERLERKIDAIGRKVGAEWGADYSNGKNAPGDITGRTMKSLSPPAVSVTAIIVKSYTRFMATYLYQQRRMKMKSKLLSRKFLMALATGTLIVLNDGLDMGLDSDTIMLVVGIIGTWILGESGIDIAKNRKGANYDYSGIEAERKAAEDSKSA